MNLSELGGYAHGRGVETALICTDWAVHHVLTTPTLQQMIILGRVLHGGDTLVFSLREWQLACGPQAPLWVQVDTMRERGVLVQSLDMNCNALLLQVGVQFIVVISECIQDILAACGTVEDVVIVVDPARQSRGIAWALFSSVAKAQRARDWQLQGNAKSTAQPFLISTLTSIHLSEYA